MQKFEFLRQPFLGELAMSWRAISQGQRMHSTQTNNEYEQHIVKT